MVRGGPGVIRCSVSAVCDPSSVAPGLLVSVLLDVLLRIMNYFVQKSVKMILENRSLKSFRTEYYMLCHLVYIIFHLISIT